MRIVKKIILFFLNVIMQMKWFVQFYFDFSSKKNNKFTIEDPNYNLNNLLIVPHADDELLGCYKFLKTEKSTKLIYCSLTGTNSSHENRETRMKEFKKCCESLGCKYYIVEELYNDIKTIILEQMPQYLILPSIIDWHNEHRLVNYILYDIVKELNFFPEIIWYQISVPIMSKNSFYYQMNIEEQKNKYKLFKKCYCSQSGIPVNRFKYQERKNGKEIGEFSAEKYVKLTYSEWEKYLKTHDNSKSKKQLNSLKYSINNINKIRKESNKFYS